MRGLLIFLVLGSEQWAKQTKPLLSIYWRQWNRNEQKLNICYMGTVATNENQTGSGVERQDWKAVFLSVFCGLCLRWRVSRDINGERNDLGGYLRIEGLRQQQVWQAQPPEPLEPLGWEQARCIWGPVRRAGAHTVSPHVVGLLRKSSEITRLRCTLYTLKEW